jgi:hypothetical protein
MADEGCCNQAALQGCCRTGRRRKAPRDHPGNGCEAWTSRSSPSLLQIHDAHGFLDWGLRITSLVLRPKGENLGRNLCRQGLSRLLRPLMDARVATCALHGADTRAEPPRGLPLHERAKRRQARHVQTHGLARTHALRRRQRARRRLRPPRRGRAISDDFVRRAHRGCSPGCSNPPYPLWSAGFCGAYNRGPPR